MKKIAYNATRVVKKNAFDTALQVRKPVQKQKQPSWLQAAKLKLNDNLSWFI